MASIKTRLFSVLLLISEFTFWAARFFFLFFHRDGWEGNFLTFSAWVRNWFGSLKKLLDMIQDASCQKDVHKDSMTTFPRFFFCLLTEARAVKKITVKSATKRAISWRKVCSFFYFCMPIACFLQSVTANSPE